MKKTEIILFLCVGLFLILFIFLWNGYFPNQLPNNSAVESSSKYNEFTLSEYQWEIDNFPIKKKVEKIANAEKAIAAAKKLWIEELSIIDGEHYEPINGLPIEVFYDIHEDCWLVCGTLEKGNDFIVFGEVPIAIIKSDGTVLTVCMG